jgi:hypothetical protein
MASISALVDQLKGAVKTKEDVTLLFSRLGTKEELLQSVECENISDDGKFHVFPNKVNIKNKNVACVTSDMWVRMEKYRYDNPRITEIIDSDLVVESWSKYTSEPLCTFEWQQYALYSDEFMTKDYGEDEVDFDDFKHTGDHKDPSYDAFVKITAYLYFHLSSINFKQYKLCDTITLFFVDLTGDICDYQREMCAMCQKIGDCNDRCTGRIGLYDDCLIVPCIVKKGHKLVGTEETYETYCKDDLKTMTFMILK